MLYRTVQAAQLMNAQPVTLASSYLLEPFAILAPIQLPIAKAAILRLAFHAYQATICRIQLSVLLALLPSQAASIA